MLPRLHRLRLTRDIQAVYKGGKRAFHPLFRLAALPTQLPVWRADVIVSTKVSRKAVDRNLLKRRLRAIIWEQRDRLAPGYDIVVITQPAAKGAPVEKLQPVFEALSKKLGLYVV